jgi:hypothetical protein
VSADVAQAQSKDPYFLESASKISFFFEVRGASRDGGGAAARPRHEQRRHACSTAGKMQVQPSQRRVPGRTQHHARVLGVAKQGVRRLQQQLGVPFPRVSP